MKLSSKKCNLGVGVELSMNKTENQNLSQIKQCMSIDSSRILEFNEGYSKIQESASINQFESVSDKTEISSYQFQTNCNFQSNLPKFKFLKKLKTKIGEGSSECRNYNRIIMKSYKNVSGAKEAIDASQSFSAHLLEQLSTERKTRNKNPASSSSNTNIVSNHFHEPTASCLSHIIGFKPADKGGITRVNGKQNKLDIFNEKLDELRNKLNSYSITQYLKTGQTSNANFNLETRVNTKGSSTAKLHRHSKSDNLQHSCLSDLANKIKNPEDLHFFMVSAQLIKKKFK